LGGGGGDKNSLYNARLTLTPYPPHGVLIVAWSWLAAGIDPGHETIAVPAVDDLSIESIWET
jgi:hypothetical protein